MKLGFSHAFKIVLTVAAISCLFGCTRIVLEPTADEAFTNVRSDIKQINRITAQFNANSAGINDAESEEQMRSAFERNRTILDATQTVFSSLSGHLDSYLNDFPAIASGGRPSRATLSTFRDALGNWLAHQVKMQAMAERCMNDSANFKECIARDSIDLIPEEYRVHDAYQSAWSALRTELVEAK